jgi:monoamine oxidase
VLTNDDYTPKGGYSKLLKAIYQTCKAEIKLEHKVLNIDYSKDKVTVITDKGSF